MDLSVIIVTWQSERQIGRCIRSVLACADGLSAEIIVIDNASADGTASEVNSAAEGSPQDIELVLNSENRGFAAAVNQGLAQAKGDFILLLNPDTELVPGSLRCAVEYLRSHPEVGIAGGKILNFDGSLQPSVRRFPTWRDQAVILLKLHNFFPRLVAGYFAADFDYERVSSVDQVRGGYFYLTRPLLEKIGPMDERFFIWFEEVDYCRRAKNCGFEVAYLPFSLCRHEGGSSFGQQLSLAKQRWLNASMKAYFKKHGGWTARAAVTLLSPISLALAWAVQAAKIKPRKYV